MQEKITCKINQKISTKIYVSCIKNIACMNRDFTCIFL